MRLDCQMTPVRVTSTPMPRPLVIAHHVIFGPYGWWLPNDPRGSSSYGLRNINLADLGEVHHGRRIVQPSSAELGEFYREAGERLKHELLEFDETDRVEIGAAFAEVVGEERYTCWACAVMPDHVHLLIRKHEHRAEEMIAGLQARSRKRLKKLGRRSPAHPVWGGPGWKVFLEHPDDVRRIIGYIENNPARAGLRRQKWPFVREYDDWPLHEGHSENSPYVKRLKAAGRYP